MNISQDLGDLQQYIAVVSDDANSILSNALHNK